MSFAVNLQGVSKSFGAVKALENVSLEVEPGEMHSLVGENGAGKTTLMRILYGALNADQGSIEIEGKVVSFRNSADAVAGGVGMVSQHYGIIPALTCLENLILGAEEGPFLRKREQTQRAEALAQKMGFQFDWDAEASTLSPAGNQKLEILKLLWRKSRIMILDEPTAMLSPADADALFESLQGLMAEGATVILVTHRLPEVMRYCRRVTVLRGGRMVAEKRVEETDDRELARLIVGEGSSAALEGTVAPPTPAVGPPLLQLRGVTVKDSRNHEALVDVDLSLSSGELVGVAGVDGNGQRELLEAVLGTMRVANGQLLIGDQDQKGESPGERLRNGLRLIPEDRHSEAVIEGWSLEDNAALGLHTLPPLARGAIVDPQARHELAVEVAERFSAKHGGLRLPMASLSGGNQQRIVAARALELNPKLLVAFQPARGLDLGAAAQVYQAIRDACTEGMAALVISFDLDELLTYCDRIVVLNHGRLFVPAQSEEKSRDAIGRLMVAAG